MTHAILTKQTISITEFKTNPRGALKQAGHYVAVLAHNRPIGYFVTPDMFEKMFKAATIVQNAIAAKHLAGGGTPPTERNNVE